MLLPMTTIWWPRLEWSLVKHDDKLRVGWIMVECRRQAIEKSLKASQSRLCTSICTAMQSSGMPSPHRIKWSRRQPSRWHQDTLFSSTQLVDGKSTLSPLHYIIGFRCRLMQLMCIKLPTFYEWQNQSVDSSIPNPSLLLSTSNVIELA